MTCYPVVAGSLAYDFCPADPPAPAERLQSLLRARLVDEITNEAPLAPVTVASLTPGLRGRAAPGGLVGLVGRPAPVFGALLPANLEMMVRASGYVEVAVATPVGAQPNYPDAFDALILPDIQLHRLPVGIAGRAIARNGVAPAPVAGADVAVTGFWATLADVEAMAPATPAHLVSLLHPLTAARPAAVASVREQPVVLAGQPKTLVAAVRAGAQAVRLSNSAGIAAGDLLAIDHDDPGRIEYLEVTLVEPQPDPLQPARVDLAHRLSRDHLAGVPVRRAGLGVAGPAHALTRAAIVGDTCLFLAGSAGLPDAGVLEISGGGPAPEYRQARRCNAVTDAEGDFRLPPVSRVAMVEITGTSAAFAQPAVQRLSPLYGAVENRIEVTFR